MLRCKDIVDLLEAYLGEGLDPATTEALTAHLADCPDCTAFLNTYRRTVGTTRELREEELPAPLRERLLAFLRRETAR
jgi:anti-sigma factor RsiW